LPDFTGLVERVGPAVVNVTTRSKPPALPDIAERHYEVYRGLTGDAQALPPRVPVVGIGSGFILGDDGYVLTNAHVIEGADEVYVRVTGKRKELRALVVGADKATDIALLKVEAKQLPVARTGSSEALKVGDWVAAIGSPFGFENTITAGIISAKERRLPRAEQMPFLQSDVAINPGSSGGPLVNLQGEVVGVNSKIYTRTGGYMGVSFAIPIETALKVSAQLRTRGYVARGTLGVETQAISDVLAASFGLDSARGALVTVEQPGSAAVRAGIHLGDVVLAYAGQPIERPDDLARAVENTPPGTRAEVTLWRRNARLVAMAVVDPAPSEASEAAPGMQYAATPAAPLLLTEAPLDQCRSLNIEYGLVVHASNPPGAAPELEPGDVIVAVNEQSFRTRREFDRLLGERRSTAAPPAVLVVRAGRSLYVPLERTPL
jgi:serine protease Do